MSKTILLADDDAGILTVLTRAMKAQGYTVKASENISDIDAWLAEGIGDAVVTDVTMPQGNGLAGLQRWQAARPGLPVIVMSAHNVLLNAARAQELGAVTFLPKPFDLETLMTALAHMTQPMSREEALIYHLPKPSHLKAPAPIKKTGPSVTTQESIATKIEPYLARQFDGYFAAHKTALPAAGIYHRLLHHFEKPLLIATLRATGGNQIKAAEILGLNRNTLRKKMRDLAIDVKSLMQKDAA